MSYFDGLDFVDPESFRTPEPEPVVEPEAPASTDGDFMRGLKTNLGEVMPALKGSIGYAGEVGEKIFGTGGVSTGVKDWGYKGWQEGNEALKPLRKENDDIQTVWGKVKEGDPGAFVDWLQNALGEAAGEVGKSAVVAGAGGIIGGMAGAPTGPGAIGTGLVGAVGAVGARKVAMDIWQKSVDAHVSKMVAKGVSEEAARKAAPRVLGSELALLATNTPESLGGIYGEGREEAAKNGDEGLSAERLATMLGSALVVGKLDTVADKFQLDALFGKHSGDGASRLARMATGGAKGFAVETGTEGLQTGVERFGAGKELTGDDATRDYLNSMSRGGVAGGSAGIIGGITSSGPKPADIVNEIFSPENQTIEQVISASGKLVDEIIRPEAGTRELIQGGTEAELRDELAFVEKTVAQAEAQFPGAPDVAARPPDAGPDVGQAVPAVVPEPGVGLQDREVDNLPMGAGPAPDQQPVGGGDPVGAVPQRDAAPAGAPDGVRPDPVVDAIVGRTNEAQTIAASPSPGIATAAPAGAVPGAPGSQSGATAGAVPALAGSDQAAVTSADVQTQASPQSPSASSDASFPPPASAPGVGASSQVGGTSAAAQSGSAAAANNPVAAAGAAPAGSNEPIAPPADTSPTKVTAAVAQETWEGMSLTERKAFAAKNKLGTSAKQWKQLPPKAQKKIVSVLDRQQNPRTNPKAAERYAQGAVVDTEKDTLLQAVARLGGINRDEAVGQWGLDGPDLKTKTGVRYAFHKNGRSIDDMRLALIEHGYLNPDNLTDLEEKLQDSLKGNPHYTPQALQLQAERDAAENEALDLASADEDATAEAVEEAQDEIRDDYDEDIGLLVEGIDANNLSDEEIDALFAPKREVQEDADGAQEAVAKAESAGSEGRGTAKAEAETEGFLTGQTADEVKKQEAAAKAEKKPARHAHAARLPDARPVGRPLQIGRAHV